MAVSFPSALKDAFLTALIAFILALPLAGARTIDGIDGITVEWHIGGVGIAAALIFFGRLLLNLVRPSVLIANLRSRSTVAPQYRLVSLLAAWRSRFANPNLFMGLLIAVMLVFPLTPFSSRYVIDVAVMVMTYIVLAFGLNITVGYAGLLDLGYAGFYALGAYSFALLAQTTGIGFWAALPIAGIVAASAALLLGAPVLRLRGDYFALVTLGFGEIVRLVLINWSSFTSGPNGISGIPRPTLFGLEFSRQSSAGHPLFHEFFHREFDPLQRIIFLYYIVLALALVVGLIIVRLRRLPLGRSWEAFREDEIACAALGINRTWVKLAAYSMGAFIAGLAGAFFATRQGFISPESFTFTESATMLAIVVLGGVGHPLGIVLAAMFILGLPELFRDLEQYRMLAFGAGMVLIMIWRPGGMMATRIPTIRLGQPHSERTGA